MSAIKKIIDRLKQQIAELTETVRELEAVETAEEHGFDFDFDEFKKGKLAVNCRTEEDAKIFFTYLIEKGVTWGTGYSLNLNDTHWVRYRGETCYIFVSGTLYSGIHYCEESFYENEGCNICVFGPAELK